MSIKKVFGEAIDELNSRVGVVERELRGLYPKTHGAEVAGRALLADLKATGKRLDDLRDEVNRNNALLVDLCGRLDRMEPGEGAPANVAARRCAHCGGPLEPAPEPHYGTHLQCTECSRLFTLATK